MGSAGLWSQFQQRKATERFEHFIERYGFFSGFRTNGIFFPDFRVDAEGDVDTVGGKLRGPVDYCQICFIDLPVFKLFGDFPLGGVVFCNNHYAGRVFVEPVDDAGPKFTQAG